MRPVFFETSTRLFLKNCGFTLSEIVVAVLILAVAIIPISGLITNDSKNSVVMSNSMFAQQTARLIMDTLLDQVAFDDLRAGSPGILSGPAVTDYAQLLFPGSAGGLCEGTYQNKSWHFHAELEVREIPADDLEFGCFDPPDVLATWSAPANGQPSLTDLSEQTEIAGQPSYMQKHQSIYQHPDWGKTSRAYKGSDFNQEEKKCLMKCLVLRIRWNNGKPDKPLEGEKNSVLWLVTHKTRLD
ncbi:MAG TPA: prepilin-type N-terminal cleavage/methylation domain-containing protein [Candidatus Rifleibacterium sp.]|jgi:prepilin-type N-terminal cleavage/methylation domain-containing protein|nr:prepilin-type N-terminal cleavage/methylation domain-containing protein [Candidatus Rifleibacterium sp.]